MGSPGLAAFNSMQQYFENVQGPLKWHNDPSGFGTINEWCIEFSHPLWYKTFTHE